MNQQDVLEKSVRFELDKLGYKTDNLKNPLPKVWSFEDSPLDLAKSKASTYELLKKDSDKSKDIASVQKRVLLEKIKQEVVNHLLMKERGDATEVIKQYVLDYNYIITTRDDDNSEMWIYCDGIYLPHAKTYIKEICNQVLGQAYTTHFANAVIAKVEVLTYIEQADFFAQQNKYPNLIPVKNGLLDITTKELKPFSHEYYFFNKINAKYIANAKCDHFDVFINSILEKPEYIQAIQEMFGFSLMKDYKYEKSFMLHGPDGRNGKSKLLQVLKELVGVGNFSSVEIDELENGGFSLHVLQNKLVNFCEEVNKSSLNNSGIYRSLTGRSPIQADRKFKTSVSFVNYAKMIFTTNDIPNPKNVTDAFWKRWSYVEFPYTFVSGTDYRAASDKKYKRVGNPDIIKNLITDTELSGILNWALDGLIRLEDKGEFSNELSVKEISTMWVRKANNILAFFDECCQEEMEDCYTYVSKQEFKTEYLKYCRKHDLKASSDKAIKYTLTTNLNASEAQEWINTDKLDESKDEELFLRKKIRVWRGIKFKEKEKEQKEIKKYLE